MARDLPRFLICDPTGTGPENRSFVLHTQAPRFILECVPGGRGPVEMLDDTPADAEAVQRAATAALDWFEGETATEETTALLLRYRSQYDWRIDGAGDELAFRAGYAATDALAAELTSSGAVVHGVLFEPTPYRRWLAHRGDTGARRVEWAAERLTKPGPHVWTFTLGDPPAGEPAAQAARSKVGEAAGWRPFQTQSMRA